MKYLYKYPQAAFPYGDLVETNRGRSRNEFEYELLDTGVFDQDRYFDVFVEYAKESPEDILIQITVYNRGPEPAELHVLPTLWFRNQWSWQTALSDRARVVAAGSAMAVKAVHPKLGERYLYCDGDATAAVHRKRDQHAAHLRRAQSESVRQGRHQRLHRPRPEGSGEPGTRRGRRSRHTIV